MKNYDLKKMLIKELNRINDIEDEEQKKIASQQLMKKFEQQSKTSGIYAPNNSGNIASNGSINVTGIGHIINGSRIDKVGDISVTLVQAIASAGGISPLAEPSKVDIIRRIGEHEQEIVQVDLAKIFAGLQPDYYIKRDDVINVGTSPVSPWLAVIRNGFRATYGFGFIYDRNYGEQDEFKPFEWPNLLFW